MRNHGWEVPYHPLQTVAVAVFAGISLSYYVFFVPFVGNSILKYHIYAVFSPVVLAVSILYVRCAGCDPADPGVHQSNRAARTKQQKVLKSMDLMSLPNLDTPLALSHDESETISASRKTPSLSICSRRLLCLPFACCRKEGSSKLNVEELLLYCSICEAKISRNSKHCKACDKCVHEFDHHCRWLNNCVGKRNYKIFVSLMVTCLLLLIIVWSTGIGVLTRCFTHKANFEKEILHILGSSFSRVPYIVIVFLVSLLAMSATIPLCQLFFFHLILIHKGITTYDYILATREQDLGRDITEGDGFNSLTSSPTSSSSTGISGYSPAGALAMQRGVFCTPPRMFVEHEQKVLAFSGDLESSYSAKTATKKSVAKQPHKKFSVGINPWKLARLNTAEAVKVAAHAKEASTIIRPIITVSSQTEDSSLESSRNVSGEISKLRKHDFERSLLMQDKSIIITGVSPAVAYNNGSPPSPVQLPLPLPLDHDFKCCTPSRSSGEMSSCPESSYQSCSQLASPDIELNGSPPEEFPTTFSTPVESPAIMVENKDSNSRKFWVENKDSSPRKVWVENKDSNSRKVWVENKDSNGNFWVETSESSSTDTSGDETGEENLVPGTLKKRNLDTTVVTPNEKVAVWEDGTTQGNMKPRITNSGARSSDSRGSRSYRESPGGRTESSSGSRAEANILRHVTKEWPELRHKLSVSPDESNGSFPSPFYTPMQDALEPNARDSAPLPREAVLVSATKMFNKGSLSVGKKSLS